MNRTPMIVHDHLHEGEVLCDLDRRRLTPTIRQEITMKITLGSPVTCHGEPYGEIGDVVVDPIHHVLTHLVVEPHRKHDQARLAPIELAAPSDSGVRLDCSTDEADALERVQEFAFLHFEDFPVKDPAWDVGISRIIAQPYYSADVNPLDGVTTLGEPVSVIYDRVPKGEVEIR